MILISAEFFNITFITFPLKLIFHPYRTYFLFLSRVPFPNILPLCIITIAWDLFPIAPSLLFYHHLANFCSSFRKPVQISLFGLAIIPLCSTDFHFGLCNHPVVSLLRIWTVSNSCLYSWHSVYLYTIITVSCC